jgi:hypothetical protein
MHMFSNNRNETPMPVLDAGQRLKSQKGSPLRQEDVEGGLVCHSGRVVGRYGGVAVGRVRRIPQPTQKPSIRSINQMLAAALLPCRRKRAWRDMSC